MFELPEAKRVRREDLKASDDSDWGGDNDEGIDADLQAHLNAQIARSLGLHVGELKPLHGHGGAETEPPKARPTDGNRIQPETRDDANRDEDLGEFEFRLFSTAGSAPKVVLEAAEAAQGEGGIVARRPPSYYLGTRFPTELRRQYELTAVSGEDVLARSQWRSWGLEMPWKVTKITTLSKAGPREGFKGADRVEEAPDPARRKRLGKKSRIALRKRHRAKTAAEEMQAKKQVAKEEHLKDKRKRLNRLKKLKRRAKEKEKKSAAKGEGADAAASDGDSTTSDSP